MENKNNTNFSDSPLGVGGNKKKLSWNLNLKITKYGSLPELRLLSHWNYKRKTPNP